VSMKVVNVAIHGISPLLIHRPNPQLMELLSASKRRSKESLLEIERENVHLMLYTLENGKPYIPSEYIIGSMKAAAADFQVRGQGKKTYKNFVGGGFVLIEPPHIPISSEKGWVVDTRYVVIQRNRVLRYRPRFDDWALNFELFYDKNVFTADILRSILEHAGLYVGIGDFRPQKGGSYGRFIVEKFEA